MAGLTFNNTRVDLGASELPSGYTKPTITTFTDYEAKYSSYAITMTKASVENASASTTFTAILAALNVQLSAVLTADLNTATATITAYAVLKTLRTNTNVDEVFYTNGTTNYLLVVDIFYKTA